MTSEFDYIIVGGGSAGCVLANRLSADAGNRVLLLEAGPRDTHFNIKFPGGIGALVQDDKHNWKFWTAPQSHLNNRRMYCPRGKVLGGSSAINAMCYVRGHAEDFDDWARAGCPGWSFDEVLPYFRRSETFHPDLRDPLHGNDGPLQVSARVHPNNPLCESFLQAAEQAGYRRNPDLCRSEPEGVGEYRVYQRDGQRCSNAEAYLRPAEARPNLRIETGAQVSKVTITDGRAAGVEYVQSGQHHRATARREIVLAAGALQSPHLLMVSGVGPAADLQRLGVPVHVDRPAVGQNLQDHLDVIVSCAARSRDSFALNPTYWPRLMKALMLYLSRRRGSLTTNIAEVGGFVRTGTEEPRPDIQWHFMASINTNHGFNMRRAWRYGYSVMSYYLRPYSRGNVRLSSADPLAAPEIDFNYGADPRDIDALVTAIRKTREVLAQPAFDPHRLVELDPGPDVITDDDLRAWVREHAETAYHPVGTCRMGSDDEAVLDPRLRVRGIAGLRVADASIMPTLVGGNTNAAATMIGEKAAAMILEDAA